MISYETAFRRIKSDDTDGFEQQYVIIYSKQNYFIPLNNIIYILNIYDMTQTADDKGIDLTDNDDDDGSIIPIGPRYYGIPLVKDRIDTCGPGQWISTDVVDIMIKKLKAEYLGDHYIVFPISIENIIVTSYESKKTTDKINGMLDASNPH